MTTSAVNDIEGPGKGRAFFERAQAVADSGNFDYAIEMYIQGLNYEPQNIEGHDALRKAALNRKVKGGKPAGGFFGAKVPFKGKSPKELMLNAEMLYAKDPGNLTHMLGMIRAASAGEYADVIRWFGPFVSLANKAKPKKEIYMELSAIYEKIGEYGKATEALNEALQMTPNDMELIARVKDLAAQETMHKGRYETAKDFKDSIKDKEMTKQLLEEENLGRSEEYRMKAVNAAKEEYEKNPRDHQSIAKYGKALADTDDEQFEGEAIKVYEKAFAETKTYRYRMAIGEVKIKQFKRHYRMLVEAAKADPSDETLKAQIKELQKEFLSFEYQEYKDRVANYPSDMSFLFEFGKRLYAMKRYEEAITAFQQAQSNPAHRTEALYLLGLSFMQQNMKPEAVETLKRAIDEYEMAETGDVQSKRMHYWLARAYEDTGRSGDALALYSKITQWDIAFLDARQRLAALRAKAGGPGA